MTAAGAILVIVLYGTVLGKVLSGAVIGYQDSASGEED